MANGEEGVKVGKKSFISLEIFIMALTTVAALVVMWSNLDNALKKNSADIAALQTQISLFSQELRDVNVTLNKMLVESRVQNELTTERMGDRWTAGMEEEMFNFLIDYLRGFHPEIRIKDVLSVRDIQRKYGFKK